MLKNIKRELRHLYGAGILFFYYIKWPVFIGIPLMYEYLGFKKNIYLNILWIWCVILIVKDLVEIARRYKKGEKLWK